MIGWPGNRHRPGRAGTRLHAARQRIKWRKLRKVQLKWERLSNFAPHDVGELNRRVVAELASKRDDQVFLRNLFHASELPLPRTLLF